MFAMYKLQAVGALDWYVSIRILYSIPFICSYDKWISSRDENHHRLDSQQKKKRLDISSEIVRDVHTMKFKAKANALWKHKQEKVLLEKKNIQISKIEDA